MYVQQQRNGGSPAEDHVERRPQELEPVGRGFVGRRDAVDLHRAADPSEHSVCVRREELVPLVDVGFDRPLGDVVDCEPSLAQRVEVDVQRARRQEHTVAVVEIRLHPLRLVQHGAVPRVARIGAHEARCDLVHDVHGLVDDPLVLRSPGIADVSRVDPHAAAGDEDARPSGERRLQVVVEVDGVGRGEDIGTAAQKALAQHFVEVGEPSLVLEIAEPAEGHTRVAAETLERHAQELRRAVDDQLPYLPVKDSKQQPVEQDAGASRVVDQDLPLAEVARELLDRQVEVAVPPVVLDGVVVEPEGVHGLRDPLLVRDAGEALRPRECVARGGGRVSNGATGLDVGGDQRRELGRWKPAPAARRRHAELAGESVSVRGDGPERLVGSARLEEAEVELCLGRQAQVAERLDERAVRSAGRDRHVDPVDGTVEARGERVRDLDHAAEVVGNVTRSLLVVPQAEMEAELGVRRDQSADPDQPLEDPRLQVGKPGRDIPFEHPELDICVPLERELVVRNLIEHLLELGRHRRLVGGLDGGLVVERDEGADRGERRGQADLKAAPSRDDPVALEHAEGPVRGERRLRVAERAEAELSALLARTELQPRERTVRARGRRCHLELRSGAQHRVLPDDPVGARARLAVRQAADSVAELPAQRPEDLLRTPERHAADEVDAEGDVTLGGLGHLRARRDHGEIMPPEGAGGIGGWSCRGGWGQTLSRLCHRTIQRTVVSVGTATPFCGASVTLSRRFLALVAMGSDPTPKRRAARVSRLPSSWTRARSEATRSCDFRQTMRFWLSQSLVCSRQMEPAPRQSLDPAGAGAVLAGTTAAGLGLGAAIGWAAGSWPLGALAGTMVGIPAGIFAVYRRYRGYFS